jgi:hypothetical protein
VHARAARRRHDADHLSVTRRLKCI